MQLLQLHCPLVLLLPGIRQRLLLLFLLLGQALACSLLSP
jgi:hypothetical protein